MWNIEIKKLLTGAASALWLPLWAAPAVISLSWAAAGVSSFRAYPLCASTDRIADDCPAPACAAHFPHAPCYARCWTDGPRWPCRCAGRRTRAWRATALLPCHQTCAVWCQKYRRRGSNDKFGRDSSPGSECEFQQAKHRADKHRPRLDALWGLNKRVICLINLFLAMEYSHKSRVIYV